MAEKDGGTAKDKETLGERFDEWKEKEHEKHEEHKEERAEKREERHVSHEESVHQYDKEKKMYEKHDSTVDVENMDAVADEYALQRE